MEQITLTKENSKEVALQTAKILKGDGVVVTPSETVYGLSADPTSELAVQKVYSIKERSFNKPLGIIAGTTKMIEDCFLLNETERFVIKHFWPGPLGLRLLVNTGTQVNKIAQLILSGCTEALGGLVIRVSSNSLLTTLSNTLGYPIISTSANISGQSACYAVSDIIEQFKDSEIQPDLIIDAGALPQTLPSTMLDLTGNTPIIIRKGADFEKVEKVLGTLE